MSTNSWNSNAVQRQKNDVLFAAQACSTLQVQAKTLETIQSNLRKFIEHRPVDVIHLFAEDVIAIADATVKKIDTLYSTLEDDKQPVDTAQVKISVDLINRQVQRLTTQQLTIMSETPDAIYKLLTSDTHKMSVLASDGITAKQYIDRQIQAASQKGDTKRVEELLEMENTLSSLIGNKKMATTEPAAEKVYTTPKLMV